MTVYLSSETRFFSGQMSIFEKKKIDSIEEYNELMKMCFQINATDSILFFLSRLLPYISTTLQFLTLSAIIDDSFIDSFNHILAFNKLFAINSVITYISLYPAINHQFVMSVGSFADYLELRETEAKRSYVEYHIYIIHTLTKSLFVSIEHQMITEYIDLLIKDSHILRTVDAVSRGRDIE